VNRAVAIRRVRAMERRQEEELARLRAMPHGNWPPVELDLVALRLCRAALEAQPRGWQPPEQQP
jgi:hypothetical protein